MAPSRLVLSCLVGLLQFEPSASNAASAEGKHRRPRPETYVSATVDSKGDLAITKADGRVVVVRKERDQTTYSTPVVSRNGGAVGAQAMFANCCTSYDIPLRLVVYAAGKVHRFKGSGVPIFQWGFADREGAVAYGQETVHFSCSTHYELRDIATERLIDSVDVPQPCGEDTDPKPVEIPNWVADLRAREQSR